MEITFIQSHILCGRVVHERCEPVRARLLEKIKCGFVDWSLQLIYSGKQCQSTCWFSFVVPFFALLFWASKKVVLMDQKELQR